MCQIIQILVNQEIIIHHDEQIVTGKMCEIISLNFEATKKSNQIYNINKWKNDDER